VNELRLEPMCRMIFVVTDVKCVLSSWSVARRCLFWPEASAKKSPWAKAKAPSETGGAPTHALAGDALGIMSSILKITVSERSRLTRGIEGKLDAVVLLFLMHHQTSHLPMWFRCGSARSVGQHCTKITQESSIYLCNGNASRTWFEALFVL
jgi:hypothetical protein